MCNAQLETIGLVYRFKETAHSIIDFSTGRRAIY